MALRPNLLLTVYRNTLQLLGSCQVVVSKQIADRWQADSKQIASRQHADSTQIASRQQADSKQLASKQFSNLITTDNKQTNKLMDLQSCYPPLKTKKKLRRCWTVTPCCDQLVELIRILKIRQNHIQYVDTVIVIKMIAHALKRAVPVVVHFGSVGSNLQSYLVILIFLLQSKFPSAGFF